MTKMIWLTTLVVAFLIFVVPGVLALTLDIIPAGDQPGFDSDRRLAIYGKRGVTQKFVSEEKNLTAIGTSIKNPNLKNKKEVLFNLYDEKGNLIRTSIVNGQNFQDGDFVKFVFQVVPDSSGKTYTFTIFSPEAGPEETIEVFYIKDDASFKSPAENIIEYTYDKKSYSGGLPLVTFHKPESRWEVIKKIYSSWLSKP